MAQNWNLSTVGADAFASKFLGILSDPLRKTSEKGEKQLAFSFWRDFFSQVCGVEDPTVAGVSFEFPVRLVTTDTVGWIDVLWPGVVLIEHKSKGKDLDVAEGQARDYLLALEPRVRPPVIIVSDFLRIRIVEVIAGHSYEFALADLAENLNRFDAVLGQAGRGAAAQALRADEEAAQLMSDLYVAFERAGYEGHKVSVFLVRILFLLFGDDTNLWRHVSGVGMFGSIVEASNLDGSGLGGTVQELFGVLDQPREGRVTTLPVTLSEFPYANGGLFSEVLPVFSFDYKMRAALLAACAYDWSIISPAIFGAMFQDIKDQVARRELGEHYTSEVNILKVIVPLFLDDLNTQLSRVWDSPTALRRFHDELATYQWLDPACGCGNFLVVAYRRVRDIELRLLARLNELEPVSAGRSLFSEAFQKVRLAQFHGIEYFEWSSQIAAVALFLSEHQANLEMERLLGTAPDLLPLRDFPSITCGNALDVEWSALCPMSERTFIMGNPPFVGYHRINEEQREDGVRIWGDVQRAGSMDYVANWFVLGARLVSEYGCRLGLVATNSITQGQQPPVLWKVLRPLNVAIAYAHQTFRWSNGASGEAAVHTVIIGLRRANDIRRRQLWTYETVASDPVITNATFINGYLADGPDVLVTSRSKPIVPGVPPLRKGNIPTDSGFLSNISPQEAARIRSEDLIAANYLRRLVGAEEMLNGGERWCLWLVGANPSDLRSSTELSRRIEAVRDFRLRSRKAKTRDDASRPWEFQEIRQPTGRYIAVPRHSSERRRYLPCEYYDPSVIVNDAVSIISDDSLETFGIISSRVFRIWADAVSGRLESRLRVSSEITYNNFPWPRVSSELAGRIEKAADGVLRVRAYFLGEGMAETLSDLYDPLTMPTQLQEANEELDHAVLAAIGLRSNATEAAILSKLFALYDELTRGLLPAAERPQRHRRVSPT
jgi:hypothetical protein